ncbi:MAG: hypothetical protein OXG37_09980 [Actinomycetia bacterium]|nr:hypothetical protein [Actinomycetes bacterium]
MKRAANLESIERRLRRVLAQLGMPSKGGVSIAGSPLGSVQLERAVKKMLQRKHGWMDAVPAFQGVQEWVEVQWGTDRQTRPPAGTVSDGEKWGHNGEVQLDPPTAACKLLLAAAGHGAETVAKYAMELAAHGMDRGPQLLSAEEGVSFRVQNCWTHTAPSSHIKKLYRR